MAAEIKLPSRRERQQRLPAWMVPLMTCGREVGARRREQPAAGRSPSQWARGSPPLATAEGQCSLGGGGLLPSAPSSPHRAAGQLDTGQLWPFGKELPASGHCLSPQEHHRGQKDHDASWRFTC